MAMMLHFVQKKEKKNEGKEEESERLKFITLFLLYGDNK